MFLRQNNDHRGKLDWKWLTLLKIVRRDKHRITRHYGAEIQTAGKQTLTFTNFLCHLKVNRNTLPLSERMTITANSFTKIDQPDGFLPLWWSEWENSARYTNQSDCSFWIPHAHGLKKIINYVNMYYRRKRICSDQREKAWVSGGI